MDEGDKEDNNDYSFYKYIDLYETLLDNKDSIDEKDHYTEVQSHRRYKRCKLCGALMDPNTSFPICRNCQISLFQLNELRNVLVDNIQKGERPPEWALKAARKITEILENYPDFAAYKNVLSEIVLEYIADDDAEINGIEIDELISLAYTSKNKNEILQELYNVGIVDINNDRRVLPGKLLIPLLQTKKSYGDDFASANWEYYVSSIQGVFMLDITKKRIDAYLSGGTKRNPRQVLMIFKILSEVIKDNINNKEFPQNFKISQFSFEVMLSLLGSKKSKLKFITNISGVIDGRAKLIEDIDDENGFVMIHRSFNEYIINMIERLRNVEREREYNR